MSDIEARIAVMEVKQEYIESAFVRMEHQLDALNNNLTTINSSMSRYRGMGAAALLMATVVGGAASFVTSIWMKQ